ncbi:CRTAC1 family protein [Haloplanus sp. GCM10025708]|uniref:CRTAC1 family protein n=1 Tax=Haloplanus sp. GCM10025708 TaxID=3252679 RepID=UPI003620C8CB
MQLGGENHLFERTRDGFCDATPPAFATPGRARTVVAADFDNDGSPELFINCLGQRNRLFTHRDGWTAVDPGAATEARGYGTGAAVADFDGDGTLELLVVHGESEAQPLSLYAVPNDGAWVRVRPTTPAGAPARGARVVLETSDGRQTRAVDAGSGYLCQMEPVAHFGLGTATPDRARVRWPDGRERTVESVRARTTVDVPHPSA